MEDGLISLVTPQTTVKASSGKTTAKCLIDGSYETCWTSQQDLPQHVQLGFTNPVIPKRLSLTFQGGFAGTRCSIHIDPFLASDDSISETQRKPAWQFLTHIHPEDLNRRQSFELPSADTLEAGILGMKLVFEQSSDFFGRITVYDLTLEGLKVATP